MPEVETMAKRDGRVSPAAAALLAEVLNKTNFEGRLAPLVVELQQHAAALAQQ